MAAVESIFLTIEPEIKTEPEELTSDQKSQQSLIDILRANANMWVKDKDACGC